MRWWVRSGMWTSIGRRIISIFDCRVGFLGYGLKDIPEAYIWVLSRQVAKREGGL